MDFIFNMSSTAKGCCALCIMALCYVTWHSFRRADKDGRIDNGAQNAVTIGVFFTFVGITIALLQFDVVNIASNITVFLDGMKTAFLTSLFGMLAGILIKWKQTSIIQEKEKTMHENNIQNNAVLLQVYACLQQVRDGIRNVNESINETNSAELGSQLTELGQALQGFKDGTEATQKNMNELADAMKNQIGQLTNMLSSQLSDSNKKQTELLTNMAENISTMTSKSKEAYENSVSLLNKTEAFQGESLENQNKSLEQLKDNTAQITGMKESFDKFLDDMAKRNNEAFIEALNKSIQELNQQLTEQLGENFRYLDDSVKELNAWQNDYKQTIIDTTEELKTANSMFFEFNKQVVPETKASLENINKCLVEYKDYANLNEKFAQELLETRTTLTNSGEEMKSMVAEFSRQSNAYISQSIDNTNKLTEQSSAVLQKFKETSNEMVQQSQDMIEKFSNTVDVQIKKLMEAQETKMTEEMDIIGNNLTELNDMIKTCNTNFYLTTTDKLDKFDQVTEQTLKAISTALEGFNADFREAISDSITALNEQFTTIAESTGQQGEKAVQTLAGTLAEISEKMVDNYEHLVEKIEEVDRLIASRSER